MVAKASGAQARRHTSPVEALQHLLGDGAAADGALALKDVNELLQLLWERKQVLEQQQAEANLELLLHFLQHSRWGSFAEPHVHNVLLPPHVLKSSVLFCEAHHHWHRVTPLGRQPSLLLAQQLGTGQM